MKEIQLNIESNENLPYIESIKFKFDLEILISKINKLTKLLILIIYMKLRLN